MLKRAREFFQSNAGYGVCGVLVLVGIGCIFFAVRSFIGPTETVANTRARMAVCSETGKSFEVDLKPGMQFPVHSPYSGKNTGYLADETCNWTEDGKVGSTPTYLLLNKTLGRTGPTFCPYCHRLVVRNNPIAREGITPPPTEQEYANRKSKHVEQSSAQ